jgi:hypothetical protein
MISTMPKTIMPILPGEDLDSLESSTVDGADMVILCGR